MDNREKNKQIRRIEEKRKKNDPDKRRIRRLYAIEVVFSLCILYLLGRVGYIQYVHGEEYSKSAIAQQVYGSNNIEKVINPNRGGILDRNRHSLAVSTTVYNIILDIRLLVEEDQAAQEHTIQEIHRILGIPMEEVRGYLAIDPQTQKPVIDKNYYVIAKQVPRKEAVQLEESGAKHVHLEADTKRRYVHDNLASQVIGFTRGEDNWGLENTYNTEMAGEVGRLFRIYSNDGTAVTEQVPPREGYSLITTLDYEIQVIAENAVKKAGKEYEPENVGVVVMDPNTGEVLGMAQYNSFNLNDPTNPAFFGNETFKNQWEAFSAEEQLEALFKTWGNFSISTTFEPGSIFKPIVVAAAVEENIVTENSSFYCDYSKEVLDKTLYCWNKHGHGTQSLTDVLKNSCNIGMIEINEKLGRDKFFEYRSDFGFGEKTGIDLPGEESVSSSAVMYTLRMLNPVEMASSAMGQGFNSTTIQAITGFSAVINGGNLMKPYIVSQVIDKDGNIIKENTPTIMKKPISKETSDYMRQAMHTVVTESGTGRKAMIEGYAIGGKTGTAQQGVRKGDDGEHTVSFIAYLPVENPEIVAVVVIHKPKQYIEGSTSAAPILREVLLELIKYKNIKPTGEVSPEDNINMEKDALPMDDLNGLNLVEATRKLNDMRVDYVLVGNGDTVDSHTPAAGAQVPPGSKVFLYISNQAGSEMVPVPDITGLSEQQAVATLVSANLTPVIFEDRMEEEKVEVGEPVTQNDAAAIEQEEDTGNLETGNIVYEQMPSSEIKVQPGTQIKLKVKKAGQ